MKRLILILVFFFIVSLALGDKLYLRDGLIYEGDYIGVVDGRINFNYSHTEKQIKFYPYTINKIVDDTGNIIITGEEIIAQLQSEFRKNPLKKVAYALRGISLTRERVFRFWVNPTRLSIGGTDLFVLDEILQKITYSAPGVITSTETETNSVNLQRNRMWTQMLGIKYDFGGRVSLFGNALLFSTMAKESGVHEAPARTETEQFINSVYLWEGNYDTLGRNFYYPHAWYRSGSSPIIWLGKINEKIISADLYASYALLMKKNFGFNLNFGLQVLSFNQDFHRYIEGEEYYFDLKNFGGVIKDYQDVDTLFTQNSANLELSSGLYFGFSGHVQIRKLTIQGNISQSRLPVKVITEGVFAQVGSYIWRSPMGFSDTWVPYNNSSVYDKIVKTTIPIFKASMNIDYQFAEKWILGMGVYSFIYQGIPFTPTYNHKDETWIDHSNDLSFSGINLIVKYNLLLP